MEEEFDEDFLVGTIFPVIKLNGSYRSVQYNQISYEKILSLLGVKDSKSIYTITYFHKEKGVKGTLVPGESLKMIDRLIFNADVTSNA